MTDDNKRTPSQSTLLVELAKNVELFHCDGVGYARIWNEDHFEDHRIKRKQFKTWLSFQYFKEHKKTPGNQALQDALNTLEGRAIFEGDESKVNIRIGGDDSRIVIDLCNTKWETVVVDATGWRIESDSKERFRRTDPMQPLPYPEKGGDVVAIFRKLLNVRPSELPLVIGWLLAAYRPSGPYPILNVNGEQGSAKTCCCEVVRRLVDPNKSDLRSSPGNVRDTMITCNNSWVLGLENLSTIQPWFSDCLCCISTGGGFATREHYENDEEVVFNVERPILLNGIEPVADRSDLLDRSLMVNLPVIPDSRRLTRKEFRESVGRARGKLLGGMLDALVVAMQNIELTELAEAPRMADFAHWVVSAESHFGWNGDFLEAYNGNRKDAHESGIQASPIGNKLVELIEEVKVWEGNCKSLLEELNARLPESKRPPKNWPQTPKALSGMLSRIAPNLRQIGFEVELDLPQRRKRIAISGESNDDQPGCNGLLKGESSSRKCQCGGNLIPSETAIGGWRNRDCEDCGGVFPIKEDEDRIDLSSPTYLSGAIL